MTIRHNHASIVLGRDRTDATDESLVLTSHVPNPPHLRFRHSPTPQTCRPGLRTFGRAHPLMTATNRRRRPAFRRKRRNPELVTCISFIRSFGSNLTRGFLGDAIRNFGANGSLQLVMRGRRSLAHSLSRFLFACAVLLFALSIAAWVNIPPLSALSLPRLSKIAILLSGGLLSLLGGFILRLLAGAM